MVPVEYTSAPSFRDRILPTVDLPLPKSPASEILKLISRFSFKKNYRAIVPQFAKNVK